MNTTTETRGVLAGFYRGARADLKAALTHLAYIGADGFPERSGCRLPAEHLADEYSGTEEDLTARPTCKVCGRKWDKIHGAK